MTAKEMKIKVYSLIEEYFPSLDLLAEDEDVLYKINGVINMIQMDLMPLRKINRNIEIDIDKSDDREIYLKQTIPDFYQIKTIKFDKEVDYSMPDENTIILPDDYEGTFTIYYYKLPSLMDLEFVSDSARKAYDASFEFELDPVLLEIMPYGIASDLLKMDMISDYGKHFREEYMVRKAQVDSRTTNGQIIISGGIDV